MTNASKRHGNGVFSAVLSLFTLRALLVFLVRIYRWTLSPLKNLLFGAGGCCRYSPSCSCYAMDALRQHGAIRGSWLSLKRIIRCNPWGGEGYDPVPGRAR